jgi:hypothetical protein
VITLPSSLSVAIPNIITTKARPER